MLSMILENMEKTLSNPKVAKMLMVATKLDQTIPRQIRINSFGLKPTSEEVVELWKTLIQQNLEKESDQGKELITATGMSLPPLDDSFGPWLTSAYIKGHEDYQTLFGRDRYVARLNKYSEIGLQLPNLRDLFILWSVATSGDILPANLRDINQYKDLEEIVDVLEHYHQPILELVKKKKLATIKKQAAQIVLINDPRYFVSIPLNYGSCYLANNSQPVKGANLPPATWCTGSSSGLFHFNNYARQGLIIIVLCKDASVLSTEAAKKHLDYLKEQDRNFYPEAVLKWQIQAYSNQINCALNYSTASDDWTFGIIHPGLFSRIIGALKTHNDEIEKRIDSLDNESWYPNSVADEVELLRQRFPNALTHTAAEVDAYVDDLTSSESISNEHWIFKKISENTVTKEDFSNLLAEATPEAIRDRIRRRMKIDPTKNHIDSAGHQPLTLPKMTARVQPNRKKPNGVQMNGQGKVAHKQSTRTQKRKTRNER